MDHANEESLVVPCNTNHVHGSGHHGLPQLKLQLQQLAMIDHIHLCLLYHAKPANYCHLNMTTP